MVRDAIPVEIGAMPDVARLAQEVARDGMPRVLRENGTDLAVLSPARAPRRLKRRTLTPEQREAFLSSAGAWKGHIDVEQFKRDIKAARSDYRPPIKLEV